ncbi:MAG: choice-of-anchor I family protein [Gammaproteobacteria bacterium]|nr:choice-of-anchor I family protein [Gammaproteobacteria bacterium]
MTNGRFFWVLLAGMLTLAGCEDGDDGAAGAAGPEGPAGPSGPAGENATDRTIALTFLGRGSNPDTEFDESAAEIAAYDPNTQRLFVVNAQSGTVDIFSLAAPAAPTFDSTLDVAGDVAANVAAVASVDDLGAANSVDVHPASDTIAVAIEADPKQQPGYVAFYQASDGTFLSAVQAGALPDMLTFTADGSRVVVANEGEPNGAYDDDPEGSISIIDVSGGASTVTDADVGTADFTAFNGQDLGDVRIFGPSATVAQDLEPEYVSLDPDATTAYVALQENNAIAVVDLATATVTDIWSLGFKDHRLPRNALDAADRDDAINIRNWPVFGMFMPDAIAAYEFNGQTYLVTANEGDAREYFDESITTQAACDAAGGFDFDDDDGCLIFIDEFDIEDLLDTGSVIDLPDADVASYLVDADFDGDVDEDDLNTDASLARFAVTTTNGETAGCDITDGQAFANGTATCLFEALYGFGGRSFSIFNADTRQRVFDSGGDFETITAERLGADFNSDNDEVGGDSRSDAKGPEPEAVTLARIDGRTYAFIGLERVGGILVYDVSVPEDASFVQYITSRDFTVVDDDQLEATFQDNDLGPESITFIAEEDSPNGEALIVVAHEVSGTLATFQVNAIEISQ